MTLAVDRIVKRYGPVLAQAAPAAQAASIASTAPASSGSPASPGIGR